MRGTPSTAVNVRSFLVPIIDDDLPEQSEFVNLALTNLQGGAVMGDQPVALVSIESDDSEAAETTATRSRASKK